MQRSQRRKDSDFKSVALGLREQSSALIQEASCSIANSSLKMPNWSSRTAQSRLEGRRRRFVGARSRRAKTLQSKVDELNQQANEVSKSIGQAKDAAEREARKDEGRKLREQARRRPSRSKLVTEEAGRHPPDDSQPVAPRRAGRRRRQPTAKSATAKPQPPKFDFKPLDHVALAREARPDRFRGRREGRRPRLLLPQERRRAAGAGPAAVRHRAADARRLHADHHARPGPRRGLGRHRLHSARAGDADLQRRRTPT